MLLLFGFSQTPKFLPNSSIEKAIDQRIIGVYVDPDEEYCEPVPQDVADDIPASFSDMTFNQLKTVEICGVAGTKAEMQLIKVLLAKSPVLVRMVIKPCIMEDKKSLKVLTEITKFHRASSRAEVVYNVD
ncbi:uncharacterized protein LOC132067270 [Lycium ferocissimum]|uniref:uncharacterized protein LOC132067270 n=1 Tax=Lycium ferocissimum TaxID=112874 RepID=UPI002815919D|nr:uncharacterized protein LOC132067270 [Lycium ferocissimum]